jgi:hypothetical protein
VPRTVSVARTGKVDIPLRIYGTRSQKLTFLIRTAPVHGQLTAPDHVHREAAVVTYQPPADLNITEDKFTYAVRSNEGVSAAVDVIIRIVDEDPKLLVPDAIEFPPMLVGETAERQFQITNRGGGVATGEVKVDAPYSITGSPAYKLGAQEQAVFTVVFAPTAAGAFRSEVRFSSQVDRTMALDGIARARIAILPERLELRRTDRAPARAGVFQLTNNTAERQEITLTGSERLTFSRQLTLAPGEQSAVPVQMSGGDVAPLEEEIRIDGAGASAVLPVKAGGVAAILRVEPSALAFGQVLLGQPTRGQLQVQNVGGEAVTARLHVPEPFALEKNTLMLEPGGRAAVVVTLSPNAPGAIQALLQIESAAGRVDVSLQAEAREVGTPAETRPASMPIRAARDPVQATSLIPEPAPQPMGIRYVPSKITGVTPTTATLEWRADSAGVSSYRAEFRSLSLSETRDLKITWSPHPHFTTTPGDRRLIGRLEQLQPASLYTVRVLPIYAAGEAGEPLFEMGFSTPARPASVLRRKGPWVLAALLALGAAAVAWRRFWRREPGSL